MNIDQIITAPPEEAPPIRCWLMVLGADRNLDALPAHVCPTEGCPECGEVYGEIAEVGLAAQLEGWCERLDADGVTLRARALPPYTLRSVRAVRLRCLSGHVTEIEVPHWQLPWSVIGVGAAFAVYAAMYALKKGKL